MAAWANLSTDASRRDSVTVTTRPDLIIKQEETGSSEGIEAAVAYGRSNEIHEIGEAELWLAGEGRRLVAERTHISTTLAETSIAHWRRDMGEDDVVALTAIIRSAAAAANPDRPSHFQIMIGDQIKRHAKEKIGPQLALPPVSVAIAIQ